MPAFVAQSVEQLTLNQLVDGSNPPEGTIFDRLSPGDLSGFLFPPASSRFRYRPAAAAKQVRGLSGCEAAGPLQRAVLPGPRALHDVFPVEIV